MWLAYCFAFCFGVALGSFLNVLVLRFEKHETILGRSYCIACKKILSWFELIPVFSYLMQRGRCRACRAPISAQYLLVELAAGGIACALVWHLYHVTPAVSWIVSPLPFLIGIVLLAWTWFFLLASLVSDLRAKLIPDIFLYAALIGAFLLLFVEVPGNALTLPALAALAAGPALAAPFFLLWFFSKGRAMGSGDIWLALALGWLIGLPGIISVFLLAFWIGAAIALILIGYEWLCKTLRIKALFLSGEPLTMKSAVPFGPFLIGAAFIVFFFHVNILMFIANVAA